MRKAREAAAQLRKQKEMETSKKPLSKKEKQALKAKELEDLDHLLNEMGLLASKKDNLDLDNMEASLQCQGAEHETNDMMIGGGNTASKKKKKKNKDSSTITGDIPVDSNLIQTDMNVNEMKTAATAELVDNSSDNPPKGDVDESSPTPTLDVASLIKAKTIKKVKKTTADIAAATAAKEALAKKELAAKNQKKKNKDKYSFGGPTR